MPAALTRLSALLASAFAIVLLTGCGEKPQTAGTRKADIPAYAGVASRGSTAGVVGGQAAAGWKAGDAAGWDAQMRNRAQGQNEYARSSAQSAAR